MSKNVTAELEREIWKSRRTGEISGLRKKKKKKKSCEGAISKNKKITQSDIIASSILKCRQ